MFDPDFAAEILGGGYRTGSDGTVRVTGLDPAATYALHVRPPDGRNDALDRRLASWSPRDETVRLDPARSVRGVVRDPAGRPIVGAWVRWKDAGGNSGGGDDVTTDADGRFAIEGLGTDSVMLRAGVGSAWDARAGATSPEVRVVPGQNEPVLTLDPGLTLTVEVGDEAKIHLLARAGGAWTNADSEWGTRRATFRGLKADEAYAIWAHAPESGTFAWTADARGGGAPLRLDLVPGKTIEVAVRGPAGAHVSVQATRDGADADAERVSPGRWQVRGIPDGTWTVSANARVGDASWNASAKVEAGGSVDLELAPSER